MRVLTKSEIRGMMAEGAALQTTVGTMRQVMELIKMGRLDLVDRVLTDHDTMMGYFLTDLKGRPHNDKLTEMLSQAPVEELSDEPGDESETVM